VANVADDADRVDWGNSNLPQSDTKPFWAGFDAEAKCRELEQQIVLLRRELVDTQARVTRLERTIASLALSVPG
jgi:hypothetical protein